MTELRRDAIPYLLCLCGHGEQAHDIDKKAVPCSTGGCGCQAFRLGQRRWRVSGWVVEPVE